MTFQDLNHRVKPPKFCLLFGANLSTSASKKMHNFWFKKYLLNIEYKNHIIHEPQEFIDHLQEFILDKNFVGANFTMPFKQTLIKSFAKWFKMSSSVKNTASVNTLFRDANGNFQLENTDVIGIKKTLQKLCPKNLKFQNVFVLGGGGSSASCIYTIFKFLKPAKIYCLTRNPSLTKSRFEMSLYLKTKINESKLKIKQLNGNFLQGNEILFTQNDPILIINTLPLGSTQMYADSNIYALNMLQLCTNRPTYFFDLVYQHTDACALAKKMNFNWIDGSYMLEEQAKASFELWTGIYPDSYLEN